MTSSADRQPLLPAHFEAPGTPWSTGLYLAYNLFLTLAPGLAAYWLLSAAPLARPWLIVPAILCVMLAGFGYYGLGIVSHEGYHFTLSHRKWLSAAIGTVASSTITGFMAIGFHLNHSRHHRYTNDARDPDYAVLSRFRGGWLRVLYVRIVNNRTYMRIAYDLLATKALPEGAHSAFSAEELTRLGWLNVAAQFGWLALYVHVLVVDPLLALCTIILPLLATAAISGSIIYAQHGDTGTELHDNSRSHASWLVTILMCGTNYHLEHHLYPRVPTWRLPRVHAWLRATSWARERRLCIEPRFWHGFLLFRKPHTYGPPLPATNVTATAPVAAEVARQCE